MGADSESSQSSQSSISESCVRMLQAGPPSSRALFSWMLFPYVNFPCKLQFRSEMFEQSCLLPQCQWELLPGLSSWGLLAFHPGQGPLGTQRDNEHNAEQTVAWESSPSESSLPSFWLVMKLFLHHFFLSIFFSPAPAHVEQNRKKLIWASEVLSVRQNQASSGVGSCLGAFAASSFQGKH